MSDYIREQLALYIESLGDDDLAIKELEQLQSVIYEEKSGSGTGKHDPRNPLNDLTGAEWVFFLNSVETTAYSTKGADGFAHDIRRIHPSPKPPQLMSKIIQFFTKKGGWVLDPFAGVGGTLLGCSLCGRKGLGIDLDAKYLDAYQRVCAKVGLEIQLFHHGDSHNIIPIVQSDANAPEQFDLILTDPPYGDMLSRERTGESKKKGKGEATPFTELDNDLGNLTRVEFLEQLRSIIASSLSLLKPRGYCIVFCKDLQPNKDHHNLLHADIVAELLKIPDLRFRGYKIWYDKTPKLYPFGYPFAFVANQLHQYILIFRKEEIKIPRKSRIPVPSDK